MWLEPAILDAANMAGLDIERQLNSGKIEIPGSYLNFGVEGLIKPLKPQVPNIMSLPYSETKGGLVMVPMLTPGPRKISIVLAQQTCLVRFALERLDQRDVSSFALVVAGAMECESVVKVQGYEFLHRQRFPSAHVTVIPPQDKHDLVLLRGSILLLATPGREQSDRDQTVGLDLTNYIGHLELNSTGQDLRHRDGNGNAISFLHHDRPSALVAPGGVITFAVHEQEEPFDLLKAPDMLLVPPKHEELEPPTRWSMNVLLS